MTVKSAMYQALKRWIKYLCAVLFHYSGFNYLFLKFSKRHYILMLHRISPEQDVLNISLNLPYLAQAIEWCAELGDIVDMHTMVSATQPALRFGITFDDGYASVAHVLELPKPVPMTVYLSTGFIALNRPFWATSIEALLMNPQVTQLDLRAYELGHYRFCDNTSRRAAITELNCQLKRLHPTRIDEIMLVVYQQLNMAAENASQFLNWEQVHALAANGICIGSHTHNHAITSMVSEAEFVSEIALSNQTIAQHLGERPRHFAYPNGQRQDIADFCERVLNNAGYQSAVTTIEGSNRIGDNPYMLRRFNLSGERMQTPWGTPSRAMFTTLLTNPLHIH